MTHLGIGVMLGMLTSNKESVEAFQSAVGKTITKVEITEGEGKYGYNPEGLVFTFEDGTGIRLFDDGQSCCESRYMHTDDDLDYFIGTIFQDADIKEGPTKGEDEWGEVKESQFLVVTTNKGQFTVVNYNEHNGYYGGFCIRAEAVES